MTSQDLKNRFPNEDGTTIDSIFPSIEGILPCYYGGSFDNSCDREPLLLLAMHLILVNNMNSSANLREIASEAVDGVSTSYVIPQSSGTGFYSSTKYGRMFEQLISNNIGAVFV